jgi:hypothetical protein
MPELIDIEGPTLRRARRKRNLLIALAVAVVVLVAAGGLTAAWWITTDRLAAGIDRFAAKLKADGGNLTAASRGRGGFPFHPAVVLTNAEIAFPPGAPGPWSWSGERATVSTSLFAPNAIQVGVEGSGRLQLTPLGEAFDLTTKAKTATVRLLQNRGREYAEAHVAGLAVSASTGATVMVNAATLQLARPTAPVTDERTESYGMHLELAGLTLPPNDATPLGQRLDSLVFDAHVLGPLDPALDTKAFETWRSAGGTAQILRLEARFGPLAIYSDATLSLDKDMQPIGAGTGRIQGFAPALDALVATQAMKLNDAKAAKAFLALLARPPAPGAPPEIRVPLSIQEGKLFVGPVALMTMPRIDWPQERAPAKPAVDKPTAAPGSPNGEDAPHAAPAPNVERLEDPK